MASIHYNSIEQYMDLVDIMIEILSLPLFNGSVLS